MLKRINIPYRVLVRSSRIRTAIGEDRCHALLGMMMAAEATRGALRHSLASLDLTDVQFEVLLILLALAPAPAFPAILAQDIGVSRPSITSALDALCVRGLLDRQRSREDRRNWVITLTGPGHQLADKAIERVLMALTELGKPLEPAGPMALHHLCMQLLEPRLVS